jgi:pilus assembly protein CpaF
MATATNRPIGKLGRTAASQGFLDRAQGNAVTVADIRSLTPAETGWKMKVYQRLLEIMDLSLIGTLPEDQARAQIRDIAMRLMNEEAVPLNLEQRQLVIRTIEDEVMGLGPLEPLLADSTVSDVLVNGSKSVYVERRGKLELTDVSFNNDLHLMNIIDRIVTAVGRRIDESSPMVDARLKDGSRVNAIIPPLALDGPMLSIRRFAVELLSVDDLINLGTLTAPVAKVLQAVVKGRLNVLVSGGTGAGKTTTLNILSGFIRPPNIEGRGEVAARDLVRNSLRMRPDRIIVGEVRGAEALDMLQAMNTGHDGSLTTVHANTARDALSRIENMVSMTGIQFPTKGLRSQIASAINVVLQVERQEDGKRRIVSVCEINGMESDVITMSELFRFERKGIDKDGGVIGVLKATGIIPSFQQQMVRKGIDMPVELFTE